jgi:hypothetical protein
MTSPLTSNAKRKPSKRPYLRPTASRVLASTLGTLPASVLVTAAAARFLPASQPTAFAAAYLVWIPIWLAAGCWIACCRSTGRAWLTCLAVTLLAAICVFAIPH